MSTELLIDRLVSEIGARALQSRMPLVVAIDGRSGSGKSTLAKHLGQRLDAVVIEGDDFYAGGVALRADPPDALAEICIDWRTLKSVILALKAGRTARYRAFDWTAFDGSKCSRECDPRPIIIVEGVYSARPQMRDVVDFAILIDIDKDRRGARLLEREGTIGAWEIQWHRAEDSYFARDGKPEAFDRVITTNGDGAMVFAR